MGKKPEINFRPRTFAKRVLLGLFCATMIVAIVGCQTTDGRRKSCIFSSSCGNDVDERAQSQDVKTTTNAPLQSQETAQPITNNSPVKANDANSVANATSQPSLGAKETPAASQPQLYSYTAEPTVRAPQSSDLANDFFNSNAAPPVEAPPAQAQLSYQAQPLFKSYGPAMPEQNANATKDGVGFASQTLDYSAQLPPEIKAAASLFEFDELARDFAPLPPEFNAAPKATPATQSAEPIPNVEATTADPNTAADAAAAQLRNTVVLSSVVAPKTLYIQETRAAENAATTYPAATHVVAYPPQNPAPAPTNPATPAMQSNLQPSQNFPGQFVGGVIDGSRPRARQM